MPFSQSLKARILIILFVLPVFGFSQYYWDFGLNLGPSNYVGDIGGKEKTRRDYFVDMHLKTTRWVVGGYARYKATPKWYLRSNLNWIRLTAFDSNSLNPARVGRNLNFRNNVIEASVRGEYVFERTSDVGRTGRYRLAFDAYLFGGAGVFYHNPKAQYNGKWIALQPLMTEAQVKPYSRFQFTIPYGIGMHYTIDRKYRIGLELEYRTTFTDYLDDISTTFPQKGQLSDPTAIALSNRSTPDVVNNIEPQEGYPQPTLYTYSPGFKRGDPTHNDAYLTVNVTVGMVIRGKSNFYRAKYSFGKGRKGVRRKSRAKF